MQKNINIKIPNVPKIAQQAHAIGKAIILLYTKYCGYVMFWVVILIQ